MASLRSNFSHVIDDDGVKVSLPKGSRIKNIIFLVALPKALAPRA